MAGIFDKIGGSAVFGTSKPLAHGMHKVRIKEVIQKLGQGQTSTDWWIVEVEIEESATHAIGETRSWVVNLGKPSGPNDAKAFLVVCAQCVDQKITAASMSDGEWSAFAKAACDLAQPLRGRRLTVEVFNKPKKDGGDFSKHIWSPVAIDGAAAPAVSEVPPPPAPPVPPAPPAPAALPPALVAAIAPYKAANYAPAAIVSALGAWATSQGFTADQLQAAAA